MSEKIAAERVDHAQLADDALLSEVVHRLVDTLQPERIYLFGSRAREDAQPDSDYDLLVVLEDGAAAGRDAGKRAHGAMWACRPPLTSSS